MDIPAPKTERTLLILSGAFLFLNAVALTLAPAARARAWEAVYPWEHWLAWLAWVVTVALIHTQLNRRLPERDPYLLPAAALLSGWGLLTIWRLTPEFGLRQMAWLLVGGAVVSLGLRLPADLGFLRRYKYVWLSGGLLLTAATLVMGTNPMGAGPRLWLSVAGLYLQPSEPLKLLLVIYLAAYLADRQAHLTLLSHSKQLLPLLAPTLIMTGLALVLLVVQRDLGTASIFMFLYAAVIYAATRQRLIALLSVAAVALAGLAGYLLFDVVRVRVDAWINPWLDPSGRSYQIVQSLLAVANGGLFGRGPGMGSPTLVPVSQSDFIFAAIAEEYGLLGALALLVVIGLLVSRGLNAALNAGDPFRRYLAAGLTAHLAAQSILIIGGNLRLLPLTGVTLPFVSYGGSSLVISFMALLLLLRIGASGQAAPAPALLPYRQLSGGLLLGLAAAGLMAGWWGYYRGPSLLTRTDNARRAIADLSVPRGSLLDRNNTPLVETLGAPGAYSRRYNLPALSPVIGYTNDFYGQSSLEASLDPYLRGLQGNPELLTWWNHLLYGQPPAGLDVRLSLDIEMQNAADLALQGQVGAVVLLNAETGEILAMASSPTFDANTLDENWADLLDDPSAPLLNRAVMGLYPPGAALGPLLLAAANSQVNPTYLASQAWGCAWAMPTGSVRWSAAAAAGCQGAASALGKTLGEQSLLSLYSGLGLYTAPALPLTTITSPRPDAYSDAALAALGLADPRNGAILTISPLQAALAAAALSSDGVLPAPRLAMAVNTPESGWVILPAQSQPVTVFSAQAAQATANALAEAGVLEAGGLPVWQSLSVVRGTQSAYTWYLSGTLPNWQAAPLAVAVLLETDNPALALEIGQAVLRAALGR